MNHTNSIQTEYYEDNDQPEHSGTFYHQSPHMNSHKRQIPPETSLVVSRIEANIKDYHQQIKNNKNVINQLECQRKFFQKLSIKQKDKISQIDLNKIKCTYEQQIFHIKQQTSSLHQIIANYHQQQQQTQSSFNDTYSKIISNKEFLMETLIQLEKENEEILTEIAAQSKQLKNLEQKIDQNQKNLKEKQSLHRKYVELQIQIQKLQKKLPPKKTK